MTNNYNAFQTLLEQKIALWLAKKINCPLEDINHFTSFTEYGLDSISSAQMLNMLEEYVKKPLEEHLVKDYKTIPELAKYLSAIDTSISSSDIMPKRSYDKYLLPTNLNQD